MKNCIKSILIVICTMLLINVQAQSAADLVKQVKQKLDKVDNYVADGDMRTNVSFLKVPEAKVKVYFKKPGSIKIVNEQGISLVPKGAINFSLNMVLSLKDYDVIDAGNDKVNNIPVRVVKMVPTSENGEIVISTLFIDVARSVVLKAKTTTRDNGTYELQMQYGKYVEYALPDNVLFTFNTKEYKLPKGLTFDYDDGSNKTKAASAQAQTKGEVRIKYNSYVINKGVNDDIFKK